MLPLPQTCTSVCSALVTDGSVHLISCLVSLSYMSGPAWDRYTFSNQSVSVQESPEPAASSNGVEPASDSVCAALVRPAQSAGGCTPASSNALVRYQMIDLYAAFTSTPYVFPSTDPSSFQYGV